MQIHMPSSYPDRASLVFLHLGNGLFCRQASRSSATVRKNSALTEAFAPFFPPQSGKTVPSSEEHNLDELSQTILRLTAVGKPTKSLSYEVHVVASDTFSSERISGGNSLTFGSTNTGNVYRYRALDANWNFVQQDQTLCTLVFDRFNIKQAFDWGDVTTGRQR